MARRSRLANRSGLGNKGRWQVHVFGVFLPSGLHDNGSACGECCMRESGMVSSGCAAGEALRARIGGGKRGSGGSWA